MDFTNGITVNAHSSVRIEDKYTFRIDPYMISGNLRDTDIVLVTHPHYDHFSPTDIQKVAKDGALFIAPETMRTEMFRVSSNLTLMNPGEETEALGVNIKALTAYNRTKEFHPKSNKWLGYLLTFGKTRVYVAGDLDKCDEATEGFCDIAIVPIGGNYTFDCRQAAKFVNTIKPKYVIPVHYGLITGAPEDGSNFEKLVDPSIKCVLKISG